jgi:hypothetical protein
VPTALANRFDLAPRSGADCGEYRIVYAMVGGTPIADDGTNLGGGAVDAAN